MSAQFLPLLEENKHWIFLTHQENDAGVNILSGFIVNVQGDTLINDKTYSKLYSHKLIGQHNCQSPPCFTPNYPYQIESGTLYAFLREDLQNGIVYHINPLSNNCMEEYQIFNFQKIVGDTLDNCVRDKIILNEEDGIIDNISSVIAYNAQRKVLHTFGDAVFEGMQFSSELKITEGIGFDLYGFLAGTQDELVEVCFGTLTECNILTTIKNIELESRVILYPNPVVDWLKINSKSGISKVVITNSKGQKVYSGNNTNINLHFLDSGLYFVHLFFNNDELVKAKFMKIN